MQQPQGFVDPHHPKHVCALKKSLYRLKQAPNQWFTRLSTTLEDLVFTSSNTDTSLFIFCKGTTQFYCLIYVDDIILIGNDSTLLKDMISYLQKHLPLKNLGGIHYFLGIEMAKTKNGHHLS